MRKHLRKVKWMIIVVIGPEFGVAMAFKQFMEARKDLARAKKIFPDEKLTLTHAFYANMGGFAIDARREPIIATLDGPKEAVAATTDEVVLRPLSFNSSPEGERQGPKVNPIQISRKPASDDNELETKYLNIENGFVSSDFRPSDLRIAGLVDYRE